MRRVLTVPITAVHTCEDTCGRRDCGNPRAAGGTAGWCAVCTLGVLAEQVRRPLPVTYHPGCRKPWRRINPVTGYVMEHRTAAQAAAYVLARHDRVVWPAR